MAIYMPAIIWIFETKVPNYRCEIRGCETQPAEYKPAWWEEAIPSVDGEPSTCERYKLVNASLPNQCVFDKSIVERCDEYIYETSERSTLHDFNLHCEENYWKLTLIGTMTNTGLFIGLPITGMLSDRFGRKTVLLGCIISTGFAGLIRSFSNSYVFFITMSFLDSVARGGSFTNAYIIALEFVAPEKRTVVGVLLNISCSISGVFVGALAWSLQTWRTLDQILYGASLIMVTYYWLLPESVRWLLTRNMYTKVEKILRNIAKTNGTNLSEQNLKTLWKSDTSEVSPESRHKFKELLKSPILTRRYINCAIFWGVGLFSYYGLTINSVALSSNPYFDFILTMLVEIPGSVLVYFMLDRIGRRYTLATGFFTCAVSCLSFIFVPEDLYWLQLCIYLFGKFGTAIVVAIVYIVTSECFPTNLRSSLLSSCSMCGRLGGMLAPQIPLLKTYWEQLPLVLFGSSAVVGSILSLQLPETVGTTLPDTVEEAENIGKLGSTEDTM
ncbi:hypothetical protein PPYR_04383 [Photinus pyralis]|nr:solute carrier family 22 member 1-like isoform X2 [Photinus pyralis]XP_031334115.1 solute carrier family 22 member 1-like isoform X2 [Photinus pyralis]XP_031334116.1 solute carrier family 22 member 1-like isoform X2 [Photinus pyralis]KAB0802197.1 hypothetical protein PPYR_04383 [Photinus pyralis]